MSCRRSGVGYCRELQEWQSYWQRGCGVQRRGGTQQRRGPSLRSEQGCRFGGMLCHTSALLFNLILHIWCTHPIVAICKADCCRSEDWQVHCWVAALRGMDCMLASNTSLASAGRSPGACNSRESPFQLSRANSPGACRLKPLFMKKRILLENPATASTTASRRVSAGSQVALAACPARSCTGAREALPRRLAASTQIGHTRQALKPEASVPATVNCARCGLHTAYSRGPADSTVFQFLKSGSRATSPQNPHTSNDVKVATATVAQAALRFCLCCVPVSSVRLSAVRLLLAARP